MDLMARWLQGTVGLAAFPGLARALSEARRDLRRRVVIRGAGLQVADAPVPKRLSPGAMCHSMAAPPQRLEYVCPTCHAKTLYSVGEGENRSRDDVLMVQRLDTLRRQVKAIDGLAVSMILGVPQPGSPTTAADRARCGPDEWRRDQRPVQSRGSSSLRP